MEIRRHGQSFRVPDSWEEGVDFRIVQVDGGYAVYDLSTPTSRQITAKAVEILKGLNHDQHDTQELNHSGELGLNAQGVVTPRGKVQKGTDTRVHGIDGTFVW